MLLVLGQVKIMNNLMLNVRFWMFLAIFFLNSSIYANSVFEFDAMPINISESDFLKIKPEAKLLAESNSGVNSRTFLYILKNNIIFQGAKVISSTRGFVSGNGCEVGMGFKMDTIGEAGNLIDKLKLSYEKNQSKKTIGDNNRAIYLENEGFFAVIVLYDVNQKDLTTTIGYSVTSKSCGIEAANIWQTIPR